ncbi:hypothetical protein [Streptomyces sp. HNM0574]|uniref:hypothetical protein n=1 Tax=Streptomyces sp. HNM0574 TaxID=2714954 RepID=UPI00146C4EB8|nr:hypothetical protein [Streptomyces sp. HNM0574]NLU68273.1 hypothetical protein [Streptomyces sp. HNM0574]
MDQLGGGGRGDGTERPEAESGETTRTEAEHPELGRLLRTYRPARRGPARHALNVLALLPFSFLLLIAALVLREVFGVQSFLAAGALSGLVLLAPSVIRMRRHRKRALGMRLYEHGLLLVAADGSDVVHPWASTTLFADGWNRYKLATPEGLVSTIGAAHRTPLAGGERIPGLRTRTVVRGARFPEEAEWGPAIRRGVRDAQLPSALATVRDGGEVTFGDLVVSRERLRVRRPRGRDDFTPWADVDSVGLGRDGWIEITSRSGDFPSACLRSPYHLPGADVFLALAHHLHEGREAGERPASNTPDSEDTSSLVSLYVAFGIGACAAWRMGTGVEIEDGWDVLLAALVAVLSGGIGSALGLGVAAGVDMARELLVGTVRRWYRHRRYLAAGALVLGAGGPLLALLVHLFREFPDRFVPLAALLFFGGWTLRLAIRRCEGAERRLVRHLPDLPGIALFALAAQQLLSGDVLTTGLVAGLFFPLAAWLSWHGWRTMKDAPRPSLKAAADLVLAVELGVLLVLFTVWLANLLTLSPSQVDAVRAVWTALQGLTEVDWQYWLAAYTALALGSYAVLRWPERTERLRQRLRPARLGEARLPLGALVNFARRFATGLNVGLMVALLFAVSLVPVSEGVWRKPVAERYALETQRRQHAEGAEAAYEEIREHVTAHPAAAARLRAVVESVDRTAPSEPGEPVNPAALETARQMGRFQAGTLDVEEPDAPEPEPETSEDGLGGELEQLDEGQERTAEREQRADRFAELASLAVTRTFDIPDLGDNGAVQILKEYFGGLVEDGPVKRLFLRWAQRTGPTPPDTPPPPDGERLVRIDVGRLADEAYTGTRGAVERAGADRVDFILRFGLGATTGTPSMAEIAELANQHRYLRHGTGTCSGCVHPDRGGGAGPDGGGGGGRRG